MPDDAELSCRELVELITDYLEEALDPLERQRFEEHLRACPHCRVYLEQMRLSIRFVGSLRERSLPADVKEELMRVFREWKRSP